MRKFAESLMLVILTSTASACALAPEGYQPADRLLDESEPAQPDESDVVPKEDTSSALDLVRCGLSTSVCATSNCACSAYRI